MKLNDVEKYPAEEYQESELQPSQYSDEFAGKCILTLCVFS